MKCATAIASFALAGLIASTCAMGAVIPELVDHLTRGIQKGLQTSARDAKKEIGTPFGERLAAGFEKWLEGSSVHDIVEGQVDSFEAALFKLAIAKGASGLMIDKLELDQQREIREYLRPRLRPIAREVVRRTRELCRPDDFGQHLVGDTKQMIVKLLLPTLSTVAWTLIVPELKAAEIAEAVATKLSLAVVDKAAKAAVQMLRKGVSRKDFCKLLADAILSLPDEAMEQALDEVLTKTRRPGLLRDLESLLPQSR